MACKKCARCCHRYPCDITFDELPGIARNVGVGIEEFFDKYLVWDFYAGDKKNGELDDVYFIVFKRRNNKMEDGKKTSWGWAFQSDSPCIFLAEDNTCSIHGFKPESGRRQDCDSDFFVSKLVKANAWRNKAMELLLPSNYQDFNVSIFYK